MNATRTAFLCIAIATIALSGCELFSGDAGLELDVGIDIPDGGFDPNTPLGPNGFPVTGDPIGADCGADGDCRSGLACEGGACAPVPDGGEGEQCTTAGECSEGLTCGALPQCVPSAGLEEGQQCTDLSDCAPGLRCNIIGFSGICEPEGGSDIGQMCESNADCLSPLMCGSAGTCLIPGFGGAQLIPPRECAEPDSSETFRAYFEVPGSDLDESHEFYRMPFPNDGRIENGQVNLDGYYNPGLQVIGGELIDLYVETIEQEMTGWSTNPTVFFRFNEAINFGTLTAGEDDSTLWFVNIDPDSPDYGRGISFSWAVTTGRGNFICHNYVAVRPSWRSPLRHGETYAVYMTDGIRSEEGDVPVPDADFADVLDGGEPTDPRVVNTWRAYQPFRDYLSDQDIPSANIINAAVFTTMDPDEDIPAIRDAVRARPAPTLSDFANCDDGDTSPCDDGAERGCVDVVGGYTQIHALYEAPIFQAGTRPYLMPEDGGNIEIQGGEAVVQGTEEICVSMTIPNGEMPEEGWPVVMYAHGTGGSFTSHISDGTAGRVANADAGGETVQFVSISIDGVQHGPRRGDTDLEPEPLFFNFANPNAALGNTQQGAADYFVLTQLVENVDIGAGASPTGDAIRFNPDEIHYFGHSQGATVGAPFVAYEPSVQTSVFSGAGGSLTLSLLNKTEPVDIASAVAFVLNESGGVSDNHPFLSLLQMYIDPVDSINYGRLYFREVPEEREACTIDDMDMEVCGPTPVHVFQSYGTNDSYSPEATLEAFGGSIGLQLAEGSVVDLPFQSVEYPVSGNRSFDGNPVTAVMISYRNADYDGHFVIFRDQAGQRQSMEFLGSAVLDGVPTITQ